MSEGSLSKRVKQGSASPSFHNANADTLLRASLQSSRKRLHGDHIRSKRQNESSLSYARESLPMSQLSSPACLELSSPKIQEKDAEMPLTPRSKVKAMLAAFDDSGSDASVTESIRVDGGVRNCASDNESPLEKAPKAKRKAIVGHTKSASIEHDDEDEDIITAPRGKLAARLHRNRQMAVHEDSPIDKEPADAYRRVRDQLLKSPTVKDRESESSVQSKESQKEIMLTRKLLTRKKKLAAKEVATSPLPPETSHLRNSSLRSPSLVGPLMPRPRTVRTGSNGSVDSTRSPNLFPIPDGSEASKARIASSNVGSSEDDLDGGLETKQSRLAELVARKKEERRVKEVAERRKREERATRETISSGASEADSEKEVVANKRLTQLSKPTRKASKRALEEIARENERMKQETQRINRNRQLTHQAVTKKKVTKESLLARFNFLPATVPEKSGPQLGSSSTQISSALPSDAEEPRSAQTPSTSPIPPSDDQSKTSQAKAFHKHSMSNQVQPVGTSTSLATNGERTKPFADLSEDELPTLDELITQPVHKSPKGKGKAVDIGIPEEKGEAIKFGYDSVPNDMDDTDYHLQGAYDSISITHSRRDKGKGKAIEAFESTACPATGKPKTVFTQPPIKVTPLLPIAHNGGSDSDDLDIVDTTIEPKLPLKSRLEILNRAPLSKTVDQRPLQTLRALAHLASPSRQKGKSRASMTAAEMQQSLQMKARQQAANERAEKIQDARDRGVIIQTADEREKDQADLEDLLEKTRREVGELGKKEKEAAKRKGQGDDQDGLSSSEDEDYKDEDEEMLSEVSGSEEDGEGEREEDGDDQRDEEHHIQGDDLVDAQKSELIDQEASENDADGEDNLSETEADALNNNAIEVNNDDPEDGEPVERRATRHNRRSKANRVIDDDELEFETPRKPSPRNPLIPILPGSDDSPIGLTQAFAATMESGDTQIQDGEGQKEQQEFLAFVHGKANLELSIKDDVAMDDAMVVDSQAGRDETQGLELNLDYVQSQADHNTLQTQTRAPTLATQFSEIPEPSQDVGFKMSSPAPERFVSLPPSTVETVLLAKESPICEQSKKRGRLRRRVDLDNESDPEGQQNAGAALVGGFSLSANAFDVLKRGAKSALKESNFDKKTSNAKEMVEEQAQESEDEYAGLGGASDDESGGEMDEETKKMMDDEDIKVDERKLAAFYA